VRTFNIHKQKPIIQKMKTEQTAQIEPTPGTWRVAWGKIIDQDDKAICMLTYRKNAWNGDLIAAAPDMRDALRAIVDAWGHQDSLLIEQAKAALAKAERSVE
jgi:hypothetical protein